MSMSLRPGTTIGEYIFILMHDILCLLMHTVSISSLRIHTSPSRLRFRLFCRILSNRHRKDALASERLTSSPYVANIYGFCGNSGVFDYADDGDIDMLIWPDDEPEDPPKLTRYQKLDLALQVSRGVAASHNVDREGRASLAHTDISREYRV